MNDVFMYPNPSFGKPGRGGRVQHSELVADPMVAGLPGVKSLLRRLAMQRAARAAAHLATHKVNSDPTDGPGSEIQVEQGRIDAYVWLVDHDHPPNAMAIEGETNALAYGINKRRLVKRPSHKGGGYEALEVIADD